MPSGTRSFTDTSLQNCPPPTPCCHLVPAPHPQTKIVLNGTLDNHREKQRMREKQTERDRQKTECVLGRND